MLAPCEGDLPALYPQQFNFGMPVPWDLGKPVSLSWLTYTPQGNSGVPRSSISLCCWFSVSRQACIGMMLDKNGFLAILLCFVAFIVYFI